MKQRDRLYKEPKPALQGFRVEGGLKNMPHNFGLDLRRNKALYLLLIIILAYFIIFQELICKGWFQPPNTYDCGSFVVN